MEPGLVRKLHETHRLCRYYGRFQPGGPGGIFNLNASYLLPPYRGYDNPAGRFGVAFRCARTP